eukprot:4305588-Alexandrium_andersonii.AAC.1
MPEGRRLWGAARQGSSSISSEEESSSPASSDEASDGRPSSASTAGSWGPPFRFWATRSWARTGSR